MRYQLRGIDQDDGREVEPFVVEADRREDTVREARSRRILVTAVKEFDTPLAPVSGAQRGAEPDPQETVLPGSPLAGGCLLGAIAVFAGICIAAGGSAAGGALTIVVGVLGFPIYTLVRLKGYQSMLRSHTGRVVASLPDFTPTQHWLSTDGGGCSSCDRVRKILLDEERRKLGFAQGQKDRITAKTIEIAKVLRCELVSSTWTVTEEKSSGSSGRAVVGALIAGPVGAAIGGMLPKKVPETHTETEVDTVSIIIDDLRSPLFTVQFHTEEEARHWRALLTVLIAQRAG